MEAEQKKRVIPLRADRIEILSNMLPVMAIVGLFVAAYLRPIRLIFENPFSYHFSHGILILGIISYMVWSERRLLKEIEIRPRIIEGSLVTLLASVVLLVAVYSETPVVEGVALVVGVAGLVLLLLGVSYLKALAVPILYLNFLFPIFDKLLSRYSPYFERVAAVLGGYFLTLFGVPHFQHDRYIELPHTVLRVVQACNGINHIIALIALVMFMGWLKRISLRRTVIYMLIAAGVGILANGLRIALIGVWTKYFGAESFHGPFDIFYSTFVFLAGFIVLGGLLQYLEKNETRNKIERIHDSQCNESKTKSMVYRKIGIAPKGIAAALLCATWMIPWLVHPVNASIDRDMGFFPLEIGGMQGRDVVALDEPYDRLEGFDSVLKRVYTDDRGSSVNLFIGYLGSQKKDKEIHKYPGGPLEDGHAGMEEIEGGSNPYRVNVALYDAGNVKREAVYIYVVAGKVVGHRYKAKINTMLEGVVTGKTNAAIVVASYVTGEEREKPNAGIAARKLMRNTIPAVQQYFTDGH